MSHAVEIERLSKRYQLGEGFHRYRTLRDALASLFGRNGDQRPHELWALRDLDLAVDQGEILGIIGRNGAGKTTLLKIVAGIMEPTAGVSRTRGRVGALLEVGTGFHPELTGRENIYLNGAVLGMSRREIKTRFDEIVGFAELEQFLDTPVKRYSSGMYLRLAFSVAAHLRTEIVAVDEVLAVGDVEFQERCLGRISKFTTEGRTVLFVSHDLGAITRLCSRAIWLDQGRILAQGDPASTVGQYLASRADATLKRDFANTAIGPVQLSSVAVMDPGGGIPRAPRRDEAVVLEISFLVRERVPGLDLMLYLLTAQGTTVLADAWSDSTRQPMSGPGEYTALVTIPPVLAPGEYVVGLWLGSTTGPTDETFVDEEVLRFRLLPAPGDRKEWTERDRIAQPAVEWRVTGRALAGSG